MGPDTSADRSCSATLNGELFVFGGSGSSNTKQVVFIIWTKFKSNSSFQISKIVDCSLKRILELPNEFYFGTCGTFLFDGEERVMFCFPSSDKKKCFRYQQDSYLCQSSH